MKKHRRGGLRAALQVILLIHVFVQLQLGAEAVHGGRGTGELDVDEVAGFHMAWVEGELAFAFVGLADNLVEEIYRFLLLQLVVRFDDCDVKNCSLKMKI